MSLESLTADQIKNYSYNELIGLVRETNRPPGGSATIAAAAKACFLAPGRNLLEIGTATGVTAIELAQLSGCSIKAIDINEESLVEAKRRAEAAKVGNLIEFKKDDATNLSFQDEMFDVVFCGNVTSLVSNRKKALDEYARVLKSGGLLAAVPMYYIKTPSEKLVQDVRDAIKVNITAHDKSYWMNFFENENFKVLSCDDFAFRLLGEKEVSEFCKQILSRPHLQLLSASAKAALVEAYENQMQLFRINLSHMGYSVVTLMKVDPNIDRELFVADKV
jgi:ubiquinone/menaquinone biosynthesis C-methylase UbiE